MNNDKTEIKLSESLKLMISLTASIFLGVSFIADNTAVYLLTSIVAILFMGSIVAMKPFMFMSIFLSLSYPVSLTIGKLEIDNLGIAFLIVITLLAITILIKRNGFAIEKKRVTLFIPFVPIILVVILSSIYGFIRSGNDSLEMVVKFFVFGVFPAALMMVVPYNIEKFQKILNLTYYITLSIFSGFAVAFAYFKIFRPSAFQDFFLGFDNPIGTSLFMMQFILVSIIFLAFNELSKSRKVFTYMAMLTAFFFVISSFQRSFLVAMVISLMYYIIISYKISFKMIFLAIVLMAVFGGILYNIQMVLDPDKMKKLDQTIEFAEKIGDNKNVMRVNEADELGTIGYRIIKIMASIKKIKQRPYFGNGLGTFSNYAGYKYPHNIFVEFLYSAGFAGMFVLIISLIYFFVKIQANVNKVKNDLIKTIFKIVLSFVILCLTILQFSGGVMSIFPYMFFVLILLYQLLDYYFNSLEKQE